jgi:hypothetical protein
MLMVVSITLEPSELAELQEFTSTADPESAVRSALREFVRFAKRQRLKQSSGQVQVDER